MKPVVKISGVFETTYISEPKQGKPVYVQVTGQGEKTPITFSFPQAICPVTEVGQVFGGDFTAEYQVYIQREPGKKDGHTFAVSRCENVKRYQVALQEIK